MYSKTISPRLDKAKPACAGYSRQTVIRADPRSIPASGTCADWIGARRCHAEAAPLGHGMPCPDLQPEADASRNTAGPDYSRQNLSTSAPIRCIRADPCSILPSTPPCSAKPAQLRQYSGRSATHSDTQCAGSQFSVLSSWFSVLSSWFLVRSSWFSVLIPFALCGRTQRVCGTIPALCCAFIHKLDGGLQSVRSSHSWH
jgi:hypothetical protein